MKLLNKLVSLSLFFLLVLSPITIFAQDSADIVIEKEESITLSLQEAEDLLGINIDENLLGSQGRSGRWFINQDTEAEVKTYTDSVFEILTDYHTDGKSIRVKIGYLASGAYGNTLKLKDGLSDVLVKDISNTIFTRSGWYDVTGLSKNRPYYVEKMQYKDRGNGQYEVEIRRVYFTLT